MKVIGTIGEVLLSALVDTGADETLLPRTVALHVGATIDDSQIWQTEGMTGYQLPVSLGEVELELSDGHETFHWHTRIGVVDFPNPDDEITIAGHAGFLDLFRVTFDGHLQEMMIELTPSFPGKSS